ncbi:MAG: SEC-C metal-binding domain-containing protein [Candidatus Micrarchaeota archaeon]
MELTGKPYEELEQIFGFDYYFEVILDFTQKKSFDHDQIIELLFKYAKGQDIRVFRMRGGKVERELAWRPLAEIQMDMSRMGEEGSPYYDEDDQIASGLLGAKFFAEVVEGAIFFSANEEECLKFIAILTEKEVEHSHLTPVSEYEDIGTAGKTSLPTAPLPRKIGRNEPCPCGSGKKYKKCCLDKNGA